MRTAIGIDSGVKAYSARARDWSAILAPRSGAVNSCDGCVSGTDSGGGGFGMAAAFFLFSASLSL